jgi:hypothetical protein
MGFTPLSLNHFPVGRGKEKQAVGSASLLLAESGTRVQGLLKPTPIVTARRRMFIRIPYKLLLALAGDEHTPMDDA